MSTGAKRTNFAEKRNLPKNRFDETFFGFLREQIQATTSRVWQGKRGVFGSASFSSTAVNTFNVTVPPLTMLDGDGNLLVLSAPEATQIGFQNLNPVVYQVGARMIEIPSGVAINPRNNVSFYDTLEERIGVLDLPDSLTEISGQLRIVVDSVTEPGVSNAGRLVTVWLVSPMSDSEAVAIERSLVVQWDGVNNYVTTSGLLGQPGGSASLIASDYVVALQGLSVQSPAGVDLENTSPYVFLGTVTGGGVGTNPTVFSTTGQINVTPAGSSGLNDAYENDRTINPDPAGGGEVEIATTESGGPFKAGLVIDRLGSTGTETGSGGMYVLQDKDTGVALAVLREVVSSGASINPSEPVTKSSTSQLNFTRVGIDLLDDDMVQPRADFVLISGSSGVNGLFLIDSLTSGSALQVRDLGGAVPVSWPAETGTAKILRASLVGSPISSGFAGANSVGQGGWEVHGGDANFSPSTLLSIYPWQSNTALKIYDYNGVSNTATEAVSVSSDGKVTLTPSRDEPGLTFDTTRKSLVRSGSRLDSFSVNDPNGSKAFAIGNYGDVVNGNSFVESFMSKWVANIPPAGGLWSQVPQIGSPGATDPKVSSVSLYNGAIGNPSGGCLQIQTYTSSISQTVYGPPAWSPCCVGLGSVPLRFRAIAALGSTATRTDYIGLGDPSVNWFVGFVRDTTISNNWYFSVMLNPPLGTIKSVSTGISGAVAFKDFAFNIRSGTQIDYWMTGMSAQATLTIGGGGEPAAFSDVTYNDFGGPLFYTLPLATVDTFTYLKYVSVWDGDTDLLTG